jgi:tetratricopeptide (TPR) repeat protein
MVENPIQNISSLLDDPEKTSDKELNYLFNLTKKYPYSAVCFIMVAKILKSQKRTGFSTLLKSAALRSNNRAQLFNLINHGNELENNKSTLIIEGEEIQEKNGNDPENKVINKEDKILETNIFTNIIGNQLINELNETNLESEEKIKDSEKRIDDNSEFTFENWLYKDKPQQTSPKERSVNDILKSLEERVKIKNKKSFFSAETTAEKSLEEKPSMNTETLAEIYVKQGNYPKAIKIYEELMLSIPEKKLFFASRINYINSKTKL